MAEKIPMIVSRIRPWKVFMPRIKKTSQDGAPSPAERHKEFSEENGRWNDRMEDALSELDELAEEPEDAGPSKTEPTPA
jgi:hypothetical protein